MKKILATAVLVWIQHAPICAQNFSVCPQALRDIAEMLPIERSAWGDLAASPRKLAERIKVFPPGQLLARSKDGTLAGFLNIQRLNEHRIFEILSSVRSSEDNWSKLTDSGSIRTSHNDDGDSLFMINLTTKVLKRNREHSYNRGDIGEALVVEAQELARKLKIQKIFGLTRLNGFHKFKKTHPDSSSQAYLELVRSHKVRDPALSFHLRLGAQILFPVANAMSDDLDSDGWGALIVYDIK